ncbi:unnamed protein product [Darwinula stevensoni]|uniref:Uncharacterized protein n=1 Tax=Darwinula stevensoni TaxID=69355 RepID=A0A7R8XAX1_9CRUS|nr:unnamed protein product [Darwinula stevensoni]CAG0890462.1 unnamed protein product [Darwinula stevensoni]
MSIYDCLSTALTTGNINYAWWVDRHGEPQYYWDGSKAGQHICNCGIVGNCSDFNLPCNCDAEFPQWVSDSGAITNETALPITKLRFGGQQFEAQKANYTLGGLACKGKTPPPDNPAESCSSLRLAGNTHPGYYLINPKKGRLDVVMCRMDLEETDPKFQLETSARIAGAGFLHGKITPLEYPTQSCSSLRQAGNAHPGYYLISTKNRLNVVMCRMDLEETDPKFQVETGAYIADLYHLTHPRGLPLQGVGAVACGFEAETHYVARAPHGDDVLPGKLVPSHRTTYVSYGGKEYAKSHYQVLVSDEQEKLVWLPGSNGSIPSGALQGGINEWSEPVYIGRSTCLLKARKGDETKLRKTKRVEKKPVLCSSQKFDP